MIASDVLALAALVVALVALLNTIGQVLQQYYATADGYRRCSASVMGEWSRFTRRKFVWGEFRFETFFATPVIFLDVAYELGSGSSSVVVLDGTDEMDQWPGLKSGSAAPQGTGARWTAMGAERRWMHHHVRREEKEGSGGKKLKRVSTATVKEFLRTNTPLLSPETRLEQFLKLDGDPNGRNPENEPVTWIPLMRSLQRYSASLRACGMTVLQDPASGSLLRGRVLAPAVRVSKKSWNFMPSDIVKPLAVSNVRDIATMVQTLGCRWTTFRPDEHVLRAEGDGIMVTSSEVKSVGTVVSFVKTDGRSDDRRHLHGIVFSPLEGASTLGFGIIHSDFLSGDSHRIYNLEDCRKTMDHLSNTVQDLNTIPEAAIMTLITDILGILTPVYKPTNSSVTYVVRPSDYTSDEVASLRGSMRQFSQKLLDLARRVERSSAVEKRYLDIVNLCKGFLSHSHWHPHLGRPVTGYQHYADPKVIEVLDDLHSAWDSSTDFISRNRVVAREVLGVFVSAMVDAAPTILQIQKQMPLRYPENMEAARDAILRLYFDVVRPECVVMAKQKLPVDEELIESVWVEMIFRAVLWHSIHSFDEKVVAVPPRYADSNLPIYIA